MTAPSDCDHQTVRDMTTALGGPIEEFGPGKETVVVGYVFTVLLVLGGLILFGVALQDVFEAGSDLAWEAPKGAPSGQKVLACVVGGLVACAAAYGLSLWLRSLQTLRVFVCACGIVRARKDGVKSFPWADAEAIVETVIQDHLPLKGIAKNVVPMGKGRVYMIRRRDGVEEAWNADDVQKIKKFGRLLKEAAEKHGIPREVREA